MDAPAMSAVGAGRGAATRASAGERIVFGASVVLFGCALLTVFSAPTSWLWIVAILATEWGHYAALVCLALAACVRRRVRLSGVTIILLLSAAALYASPALRAWHLGKSLGARCDAAFPSSHGRPPAPVDHFGLVRLFCGTAPTDVTLSDHVYTEIAGKPLHLDLYQSKARHSVRPLILVLHGGSWHGGSRKELPALDRYLAHEGYAVAAIDYRVAPQSPFPAAIEDAFTAIRFLKAHAEELQLDPDRIILLGRSAGAQIALSAAYAEKEPGVRGVVSLYGPADLALAYRQPSRRWVLDSEKALREYLGSSLAQKPADYAAASPVNFVHASTPPTLLVQGLLDPIVWPAQAARLASRLEDEKRPHLALTLPWGTHGCDANLSGPSGQLILFALHRFLAFCLDDDAASRNRP